MASDESLGKDETGHASLVGSFLPFGLRIYGSNPMDSLDQLLQNHAKWEEDAQQTSNKS